LFFDPGVAASPGRMREIGERKMGGKNERLSDTKA